MGARGAKLRENVFSMYLHGTPSPRDNIEAFLVGNNFYYNEVKYKELREVFLESSEEVQTAWKKVGVELPEDYLELKIWLEDLTDEQAKVVKQTMVEFFSYQQPH